MQVGNTPPARAHSRGVSRFLGTSDERLQLAGAIDRLAAAAGMAGPPSWLWLAGLIFPSIGFALGGELGNLGRAGSETGWVGPRLASFSEEGLTLSLGFLLPLLVFPMRLIAGLAALAPPAAWARARGARRSPRRGDAWRAGAGLTLDSLGLWLQLVAMSVIGLTVLLVPPYFFLKGTGLERGDALLWAIMTPFLGVAMTYLLVLSVVYQLALQSLARNRRGATSAIRHGWRIARNDGWSTARAVAVDFVLLVTQIAATIALAITCVGLLFVPALGGFIGVARACYWARIYRALGGLAADEDAPELAPRPVQA
jgi:hypothetical protein